METSVYSFLTQVIREESDYKRIIGKKLLPFLNERITKCYEYSLVGQREVKFFKLISVLIKNCKENIFLVKGMKEGLRKYIEHS
jgi:hypothetical protein